MKDYGRKQSSGTTIVKYRRRGYQSLQGKRLSYKMFVDWNGDVLFCSNDWGREHVVGNLSKIYVTWLANWRNIRKRLAEGNRTEPVTNVV